MSMEVFDSPIIFCHFNFFHLIYFRLYSLQRKIYQLSTNLKNILSEDLAFVFFLCPIYVSYTIIFPLSYLIVSDSIYVLSRFTFVLNGYVFVKQ